jgi:glycine/D-amino acid oxidase-like deaminating enzyme/nitrite reductase/ring-hydroxylating ferredoxin subunit
MDFSEQTTSVWKAGSAPLVTEPLHQDVEADVCVVGAGIAGMSVAYELAQFGRSVVVLDDNAIGGGETAQTTAHLASALDDRYFVLEQLHGRHGAVLAYESHNAAVTRIEQIVGAEQIGCDFRRVDGFLFLAPGDSADVLSRELVAARAAGFDDAELLPRAPLDAFDTGPCLRFPRQAQFDPLRYLAGLAGAITRQGGRIYTGSHVSEIHGDPQARAVTGAGHTVRAGAIVVATNTPVNDRVVIHTKQAPYRTYVIALKMPKDGMAPALYWDTADPYHYLRLGTGKDGETLLIVGGEDQHTGARDDARERFRRLEAWTRKRFTLAGSVTHRWSGQVIEPVDGLAFIGRNPGGPDGVFIATGDSGNGMTHGVIAGMLIRDLIEGRDNPWSRLYDASRKPLLALKRYASINLAAASGYVDWLKPAEAASIDDVQAGTGAVVRRGVHRLAVYRDMDGSLSVCSAVCTHLGGVVRWNTAEQSWDCPCHGSRFSPQGEVLNGPALQGLEPIALEALGTEPKSKKKKQDAPRRAPRPAPPGAD